MSERGRYLVIEGSDGTGKSTQVERIGRTLGKVGINCIQIHEPDGVPLAAKLRDIIKDGSLERDAWSNVLLFTAARRANWLQAIQPALSEGTWVLAARNWLSTVVYQGYGEGEPVDRIHRFTLENVGEAYTKPDLTLVLGLADELKRLQRIEERGVLATPDTFESRDQAFQDRVQSGYVRYAKEHEIPVIDASGTLDEVEDLVWRTCMKTFGTELTNHSPEKH